jgi:hypothetical protein
VFDYANFSPQSVTDLANVLFALVATAAEKPEPFEARLAVVHLINDVLNVWYGAIRLWVGVLWFVCGRFLASIIMGQGASVVMTDAESRVVLLDTPVSHLALQHLGFCPMDSAGLIAIPMHVLNLCRPCAQHAERGDGHDAGDRRCPRADIPDGRRRGRARRPEAADGCMGKRLVRLRHGAGRLC